jgi:hypothetical protein
MGQTETHAPTLAPSHIGAARDALQAILLDNDAVSQASLMGFAMATPIFQHSIQSSPWYAGPLPERQSAIGACLQGVARIGQEESLRAAPRLLDLYAPRFAALLSEAELTDVIAFARSPEGSGYFLRMFVDGVRDAFAGHDHAFAPPQAEREALARFAQTPGGIALERRAPELGPLFRELGRATTSAPNVVARFQHDMCAIAGEQCPQQWRPL